MDVWVELVCVEGDEWSVFVLRRERERSMDGRRREYGRVWVCIYTRSSLLRTWGQPCDMSQSMRSCRRFRNDITRLEPRSEMGANPFVSRHLPPASDQVGLLSSPKLQRHQPRADNNDKQQKQTMKWQFYQQQHQQPLPGITLI